MDHSAPPGTTSSRASGDAAGELEGLGFRLFEGVGAGLLVEELEGDVVGVMDEVSDKEGVGELVGVLDVDSDNEGVIDGVALGLSEMEGVGDELSEREGVREGDSETLGVELEECEVDGVGEGELDISSSMLDDVSEIATARNPATYDGKSVNPTPTAQEPSPNSGAY